MEQISNFKHSTKLNAIYHHQMDIIEQVTTWQQNFVDFHPNKPQEVEKIERGLSLSGLPFSLHKR